MPLTGPIPEGETFFCPHCGALYAVTRSRLSDTNIAKCVVCLHTMEERESTKVPIYKLVQRPEDAGASGEIENRGLIKHDSRKQPIAGKRSDTQYTTDPTFIGKLST